MKKLTSEDAISFGKETFVTRSPGKLSDKYQKEKELGSGSYGHVYRVKNKITGETRACKQMAKGKISDMNKFNLEINIMSKTDHPSIIKLYEIYEDTRNIYLVMEECTGGELFDRILDHIQKGKMYSEKDAANIFKQLMSAIAYCHSNQICHRDLKPENMLYSTKEDNSLIKVIDFGLSRIVTEKQMKTKVGTAYYVSPEVLNGNYDDRCDIWSAGVILYILLSGEPPFNGPNDNEIYRKICKMHFEFPKEKWCKISKDAIDLIKKMLTPEAKRLTAQEVLEHPWFKKVETQPEIQLDFNTDKFKNYIHMNNLKKIVLTYIATRLKDNEVKHLRETFEAFDKNSDGSITLEELREGLTKMGGDTSNVDEIFKSMDTDKSGKIDYTEWLAATLDEKSYLKEARLFEVFKAFDKDESGKISKEELMKLLQVEDDPERINKIMEDIDKNKDGYIDYNEFLDMMTNSANH